MLGVHKVGKADRPTAAFFGNGENWKIIVPGRFNVDHPLTHNVRRSTNFWEKLWKENSLP